MRSTISLFSVALIWATASAHHSAVIFDQDREIVLEGVVSGYDWKYPHVYIFVDVEDDSGQIITWQIEGDDPRTMMGGGWTENTLVAGDRVEVSANPDKNAERNHALMVTLSMPNGETLTPEAPDGANPTVAAEDIFSLWDPSRFVDAYLNGGTPTDNGSAALDEYTEADSPESQCMPPTPPTSIGAGLTRISMQEEHILIEHEEFQVERIVYMDGRGHPADGGRTIQGHSIGRWEGDILIIDTTHFADYIDGSMFGIPSGAEKRVVERFELTDDRTQLRYEFILEDPEYLLESAAGGLVLDHSPNDTFMSAVCDVESAQRWLYQ